MLLLILGIIVFLGVHTLATLPAAKASLVARVGAGPFKGLFSLVALTGLVLIVWGFASYRSDGLIVIWTPPLWTRHVTVVLMWFAFVALACMNPSPGRIRGWVRHPMLAGVMIWALAHLLANGDLGGVLLFAAFFAWAVYDRISVQRRGDPGAERLAAFTRADGINLAVGTLAFAAMLLLHPLLIGVRVI